MGHWDYKLNQMKAKQYSAFCAVLCLNLKATHMMLESTREFITTCFADFGFDNDEIEKMIEPFYRAGLALNELKDSLLCDETE